MVHEPNHQTRRPTTLTQAGRGDIGRRGYACQLIIVRAAATYSTAFDVMPFVHRRRAAGIGIGPGTKYLAS